MGVPPVNKTPRRRRIQIEAPASGPPALGLFLPNPQPQNPMNHLPRTALALLAAAGFLLNVGCGSSGDKKVTTRSYEGRAERVETDLGAIERPKEDKQPRERRAVEIETVSEPVIILD